MISKLAVMILLLGGNNIWIPYNFKGTEKFKYNVVISEGEEVKKGYYTISLSKEASGKIRVNLSGEFNSNSFSISVLSDSSDVAGTILGQTMLNPAVAPLAYTLFAPWWGMYFTNRIWEVGSYWSFKDPEGKEVSFKIESTCEYAGIKGKKGVWRENGKVRAEICVSPEVALPLAVKFNSSDNERYEIVLVEYKP